MYSSSAHVYAKRKVARAEKYQLEIVMADGLHPLLRLLQSTYLPLVLSSVACVRNVSIHPQNESPIIESGFLQPLIDILSFKDNEEVQCHAFSTLRNLAASSERNKIAIAKAGVVHSIKELVLDVSVNIQSVMTACVAVLTLSDDVKGKLLEMGICEVLIPLTNSPSSEVQGNSATALGNLSYYGYSSLKRLILVRPNDISLPQMVVRLPMSILSSTTCGQSRKEAYANISINF